MRRALKPGLFLTAASALACGVGGGVGGDDGEKTHNPPPPPQRVEWTAPTAPFTAGQLLNPKDKEGRTIKRNGPDCWVELPFATPPTSVMPPPTMAVECPAPMADDPAWAACNGGSIYVKAVEPLSCTCMVFGNPPPPPLEVACPPPMASATPSAP
jgi:hypothetical protein